MCVNIACAQALATNGPVDDKPSERPSFTGGGLWKTVSLPSASMMQKGDVANALLHTTVARQNSLAHHVMDRCQQVVLVVGHGRGTGGVSWWSCRWSTCGTWWSAGSLGGGGGGTWPWNGGRQPLFAGI